MGGVEERSAGKRRESAPRAIPKVRGRRSPGGGEAEVDVEGSAHAVEGGVCNCPALGFGEASSVAFARDPGQSTEQAERRGPPRKK